MSEKPQACVTHFQYQGFILFKPISELALFYLALQFSGPSILVVVKERANHQLLQATWKVVDILPEI